MEETAQKFTSSAPQACPSSIRCNMERSSCEGKDVDTVSLACMSCSHARHTADGHRRVDGDDRILFKRLCAR